tara:strand:+ start:27483 stop:27785 length:303 start_codon:yes stop_codon:yes gene_type:complete
MEATNTFIDKQITYWENDKSYYVNALRNKREQLEFISAKAEVFPNGEERLPESGELLSKIKLEMNSSISYSQENLEKAEMHLDILYTARDAKADNLFRKV